MATNETDGRWIIESVKTDGNKFRPSDWIERISTSLASFGSDHRLRYDDEVQPCVIQGQKCLVVGKGLSLRKPELLAYIMKFAEDNQLRIQEERRSQELPSSIERRTE
jgi:bisphosphoglycerate-dependent phosphoglycerate mutase